jgi:hypothetical protein
MKYSDNQTNYQFIINDGNFLTDECGFEEINDEFHFRGTLQELGESLSYGDFFARDIKKSIKELESKKTTILDGKFGDSISINILGELK